MTHILVWIKYSQVSIIHIMGNKDGVKNLVLLNLMLATAAPSLFREEYSQLELASMQLSSKHSLLR